MLQDARPRNRSLAQTLSLATIVCDACVIVFALLFSFHLRFQSGWIALMGESIPTLNSYVTYLALAAIGLVYTLTAFGIYEKHALLRYRFAAAQIIKACLIWFACFLSFSLVFKLDPPISRLFVAISGGVVLTSLLFWRAIWVTFLTKSSIADGLRQRVLCIGWNDEANSLTRPDERGEHPAYEVSGIVYPPSGRLSLPLPEDVRVLGQVGDLQEILQNEPVDVVLLTDIDCVKGEIVGLMNICEKEMVQFKLIPSWFQILLSGLHLETVTGVPVLGVSQLPLDRTFNLAVKRIIDIIGAILGLIVFAPFIAFFAFMVYRESPGPVFYRQRRMGKGGETFEIIKIRSMRLDAEKDGKVGWSTKVDDRRLKIGSFMRKANIDELPQFWNVLKGEMSLVGPRPERPELISGFKNEIQHYNARHAAKPGITGWAQVRGFRGDTDLTERIKCDLFYLENWSVLLDLQIMVMTFITRKGAA
ncbi:MAG TPA: exopolysaccharide biosynthesis polyprenyl glycosylphosphotransferase [Chthoniobacterales bacterium]